MIKLFSAITLLTLIQTVVRGAYYNCTFDEYEEGVIISSNGVGRIKEICGLGCRCRGLTNNTCQFGPDYNGNYVT